MKKEKKSAWEEEYCSFSLKSLEICSKTFYEVTLKKE